MKILFNDVVQNSNANPNLKSPALSSTVLIEEGHNITINLDESCRINSIGIGNANGNEFSCSFNDENNTIFNFEFTGNGLYMMNRTILASQIIITTSATHLGRVGAGMGVNIPTSIPKEPGFVSTNEPRVTLSGQVISGVGGYNFRVLSLDSRYKIDDFAMREIINGFKYIGMGYPFFIDLTDESYKLPFNKFYANEKNQRSMSFEGGINKYLYSRRFEFEERF